MVEKYGTVEELFVYYHPITNKHLGIGRVVFETVANAKLCVEKLNNTSVMGKVLKVFLDPFGEQCKVKFEEYTTEKKPVIEEKPKVEEKKVKDDEKKLLEKELLLEREQKLLKERDDARIIHKDRDRTYNRNYSSREFATPSSSDMGYGTAHSDYSGGYGSSNTTPLPYVYMYLIYRSEMGHSALDLLEP